MTIIINFIVIIAIIVFIIIINDYKSLLLYIYYFLINFFKLYLECSWSSSVSDSRLWLHLLRFVSLFDNAAGIECCWNKSV